MDAPQSLIFKTSEECDLELIDHGGNDWMPVTAARVSFNKDGDTGQDEARDLKLMKYLADHGHTSCFEHQTATFMIECPLFIRSQIMRHRTFCLAGDNEISFSRPCDGRHYPYRLDRLFKNWTDPAQRARIKAMQIRSVNETTGEIFSNTITDVVYSGKKNVYGMLLANGQTVYGSEDHRIFTRDGWMTIGQLSETPVPVMVSNSHMNTGQDSYWPPHVDSIEWRNIPGWEGKYEVSDAGEVRALLNTRNTPLEVSVIKKQTKNSAGYACVSLSANGISRMFNVHSLVMLAFVGPRPDGMEVRHLDGNRLNPHLSNLAYGYPEDNSADRKHHGTTNYLGTEYADILEIVLRGTEDTYDISVKGPYHNFFANGVVVHNSYNEISRRYTSEDLEFWEPTTYRKQHSTSKQCSAGELDHKLAEELRAADRLFTLSAVNVYDRKLELGQTREQARAVLPHSLLTRFYMTGNLRNWAHFLKLRKDGHAQEEVRVVARRIEEKLREIWPESMKVLMDE